MLDILIGIVIVLLSAFGWIALINPRQTILFMMGPELEEPEMSESLKRMTELADEAIAAWAEGRALPREIEKYR